MPDESDELGAISENLEELRARREKVREIDKRTAEGRASMIAKAKLRPDDQLAQLTALVLHLQQHVAQVEDHLFAIDEALLILMRRHARDDETEK